MRKFHVGQRVRVNRPQSPHHGEETTVASELALRCVVRRDAGKVHVWCYRVDLTPVNPGSKMVCFEPHELIPIYDSNERGSWSALKDIWQPSGVRA